MILYITVAVVTVVMAHFVEQGSRQQNSAGAGSGRQINQHFVGRFSIRSFSRAQVCSALCLLMIFAILFALSACRLNVGNDYGKYVEFMHRLYTDQYIDDPGVPTEWGFNLVCRIIYGLSGFENYLLVFAIYAFVTVAVFLAAIYEQSVAFPFSFFMFMALGYYFQSFSTVRNYLTLGMALYGMKYVLRKEWGRFLLLTVIGAAFHKSIWVILPLYILASFAWKKWHMAVMLLFSTTFLFLQDFYMKLVVALYPTYRNTEYLEGNGISYINILRCLAVLILACICYKRSVKDNPVNHFYFQLNLGALVLYVFCSFLPFVSRIGYYLTVSHILFVPALIGDMENEKMRKFFKVAVILACIVYFAMYLLKADQDGVLVLPYKSFLFHDMVDILSDVT